MQAYIGCGAAVDLEALAEELGRRCDLMAYRRVGAGVRMICSEAGLGVVVELVPAFGRGYGPSMGFRLFSVESHDGCVRLLCVEAEGRGLQFVAYESLVDLLEVGS